MKTFTIKKMLLRMVFVLAGYLLIGLILHHWVFPTQTPDFATYFSSGKSFHSKLEGMTQTVVATSGENIVLDITLQPRANGPVSHQHTRFDEKFTVKSGTLSLQLGDKIQHYTAGESVVIPKFTPHRPFNETDSLVVFTGEMPTHFAYCLSQIYPFWDENEANTRPPKLLMQLAVFGEDFDSFPTENAPPKDVLKTLKWILAPTARLMGYKFYNPNYLPK